MALQNISCATVLTLLKKVVLCVVSTAIIPRFCCCFKLDLILFALGANRFV